MTTTSRVDPVSAAVKAAVDRVGPGLFGVACSGGADSMALAHATIAAAGAAHVVVLTIDHGLAPGSAEVAARVAAWATGQGAAAVTHAVTVPRTASLEAAAREVRHAALDELADRLGLVAVFLGHTARDQAETVLMRIVRGTGPAGLAGIPEIRGRRVRPLLGLPREAIDLYVAHHDLPTWTDPMNEDGRFTRVRFRRDILPALRHENPRLDGALVRLAASASEWLAVIDAQAAPFSRLPIACQALAAQPAAIRKRALARALEAHGIDAGSHLDALDALVTSSTRGQRAIDLPGGRVVRTYDTLDLAPAGRDRPARTPTTGPSSWTGETGPGGRTRDDGHAGRTRDAASQGALAAATFRAPAGPYVLRTWRPGDRMRPARLKGRSRKLSDLFIDAKIPRDQRANAQVLVRITDDEIMWTEHIGLAFGAAENLIPEPT